MRVLYHRCESSIASSLDRYPHKTDDVPCVSVWCCTTCDTADQTSLFDLLAPVARSSLDSFWPVHVRASGNAVKLDSKVPSLITVAGTLTQISDMIQRTGHAELQLDDGSTVRGLRIMCCHQLRWLIPKVPSTGEPLLVGRFILGLTRSNAHHPDTCGMLLVSCAPAGATGVFPGASKPNNRGRKRKR